MRDDDESAYMQILHSMQELSVRVGVGSRETPVVSGEKKLSNLFLRGHLAQRGLDPGARGGRQSLRSVFRPGAGLLWSRFLLVCSVVLAASFLGHKDEKYDENHGQNADAASFHQLQSPRAARSLHLYIAHAQDSLNAAGASAFQNIIVWFLHRRND